MSGGVTQAVVLAGGKGTRLGGLTAETPKPLLPVAGRPFIEWVIGNLATEGVRRVVLSVGYRADAFETWLRGFPSELEIDLFVEDEPLGTGGALPLMVARLDAAFFVLNGDTIFDAPLAALAGLVAAPEYAGAVALRHLPDTSRYGRVVLSGERVTAFSEKTGAAPGLINGGIYALRRESLVGLGSPSSLEQDLLPSLAAAGTLAGLPADGFFIDIGVPQSYAEAQVSVPRWWSAKTATGR